MAWRMGVGLGVGLGVPLLLFAAWPAFWWFQVQRLEKPRYRVLRKLGAKPSSWWGEYGCELRQYEPYLVAEVVLEDMKMKQAMNQGFRQVAGFIFGKNVPAGTTVPPSDGKQGKGESVSMTSPVVVQLPEGGKGESVSMTSPVITAPAGADGDGKYRVAFMMPSKYDQDTLPVPVNQNVKIREVPPQLMASIGFSGNIPSEDRVTQYKERLAATLQDEGLVAAGPATLLQYYPPFAPGFIRLNEVVVPILRKEKEK